MRAAGTAQNQLPTVFATYYTVKVADDICTLASGKSGMIFGSDGALVVDSGHVPSVTKRMITDITRLTNQPVRFFVNTHLHPDHVTGNSLYRDQCPRRRHRQHASTQFELTRPDSLYDDLTEMSNYMPQLEQPLASGRRAGGKSLTDGERAYYTEIPDTSPSNTTSSTCSWVTQALESVSQQTHAAVRQGLTQDQFQKSVDMAEFPRRHRRNPWRLHRSVLRRARGRPRLENHRSAAAP